MKKLVKKQLKFLIGAVSCAFFASVVGVLVQFLKGNVLDMAIGRDGQAAFQTGGLLLLMILLEISLYYRYDYLRGRYSVENTRGLRRRYFQKLLEKSPPEVLNTKQGDLVAEYTNQIDLVAGNYLGSLPILAEITFKAIIVSTSLFILDYRIAILTILLLTTPLYVPKLIEKSLQNAQNANIESFQKHLGKVVEWLSGFEVIKNYSIEKVIQNKFDKSNDEVAKMSFAYRKMTYLSRSVSAILSYLSHFIVLIFAAYLVLKGQFSAGQFFIAMGMIDQLSYPIISVSVLLQDRISARPTADKLVELLEHKAEKHEKNIVIKDISKIDFSKVDFQYEEEKPILKNFNLQMGSREKCLIMGPSGSGKSTIMNLFMDYYGPNSGSITINGELVNEIKNLNELVAIMRQDPILFNDTLRNNLTMYQQIEDKKVIEVLRKLNLNKFASKEGLNSMIKENGANLSGGERKRITLARTLLRNTPIIILDEPLSNVDQDTVEKIEDIILQLDDAFVFVISHQFTDNKKGAFNQEIVI